MRLVTIHFIDGPQLVDVHEIAAGTTRESVESLLLRAVEKGLLIPRGDGSFTSSVPFPPQPVCLT